MNELKKNLRIVERAMKSKGDDTNDKADEKYLYVSKVDSNNYMMIWMLK